MKNILFCLFCCSLASPIKAQDKYDYIWYLGGYGFDLSKKYGTSVLDFNEAPPKLSAIRFDMSRSSALAYICDKNGQMRLLSNGCKTFNSQGKVVQGGDSLNFPGSVWVDNCRWEYEGFPGMLAMPRPGREGHYVLFHYHYDDPYPNTLDVEAAEDLLYTEIDMTVNGGLGRVGRKNVPLSRDTFADNLAAVRHGNGRDWWVVAFSSLPGDKVSLHLLAPEGIRGPFARKSGLFWKSGPPYFNLSSAVFSPDGSRYARVGALNGLHIFRFDRCLGLFSDPKSVQFPNEPIYPGGVAFSPNSRFVYVSSRDYLYQVDCEAINPQQSVVQIGKYDGFRSFHTLPTNFYQMRLAPDGKIYMTANNGVDYLHVIHNPDAKGLDCNFQQHGLELPTSNGFCFPIAPNFRLYRLPRSPCDTLGVIATEMPHEDVERWDIFPNPVSERATLHAPAGFEGELRVFNAVGLQMVTLQGIGPAQPYGTVEVWDWPAGVYFVQAIGKEGTARAGSFVVGR